MLAKLPIEDRARIVPRLPSTELRARAYGLVLGQPYSPADFHTALEIPRDFLASVRFSPRDKLVWARVTALNMWDHVNTTKTGWALDLKALALDVGLDKGDVLRSLRRLRRMGALDVNAAD